MSQECLGQAVFIRIMTPTQATNEASQIMVCTWIFTAFRVIFFFLSDLVVGHAV